MADPELSGLRVLVIEDESLVAMFIEDVLADMGCTVVGSAADLQEAQQMITSLAFDAAVVDVNLNGVATFPAAEMLLAAQIPFMFSTGYGPAGIPARFARIPVLAKPFCQQDLETALGAALGSADRA